MGPMKKVVNNVEIKLCPTVVCSNPFVNVNFKAKEFYQNKRKIALFTQIKQN
jgi:hypothetical protein